MGLRVEDFKSANDVYNWLGGLGIGSDGPVAVLADSIWAKLHEFKRTIPVKYFDGGYEGKTKERWEVYRSEFLWPDIDSLSRLVG